MKRLFNWAINKIINFIKWLWQECRDWRTLVLFVCVCIAMGTPVWLGYILSLIFGWEWAAAVAGAMLIFWNVVPGTPFFVICLSITLGLKRIWERRAEKRLKHTEQTVSDSENKIPK